MGIMRQLWRACFVCGISIVPQHISFNFDCLSSLQSLLSFQSFPFQSPLHQTVSVLVHDLALLEYSGLRRLVRRSWRDDGTFLPVKVVFPDALALRLGNLGASLLHFHELSKLQEPSFGCAGLE